MSKSIETMTKAELAAYAAELAKERDALVAAGAKPKRPARRLQITEGGNLGMYLGFRRFAAATLFREEAHSIGGMFGVHVDADGRMWTEVDGEERELHPLDGYPDFGAFLAENDAQLLTFDQKVAAGLKEPRKEKASK